jgi:hypothetical protein
VGVVEVEHVGAAAVGHLEGAGAQAFRPDVPHRRVAEVDHRDLGVAHGQVVGEVAADQAQRPGHRHEVEVERARDVRAVDRESGRAEIGRPEHVPDELGAQLVVRSVVQGEALTLLDSAEQLLLCLTRA